MKKFLVIAALVFGATQVVAGDDDAAQQTEQSLTVKVKAKALTKLCTAFDQFGGDKIFNRPTACDQVQQQVQEMMEKTQNAKK